MFSPSTLKSFLDGEHNLSPRQSLFVPARDIQQEKKELFDTPPLTRFELEDKECSFCCAITSRAMQRGKEIPLFCRGEPRSCGKCKRFGKKIGTSQQNDYALDIFKSMIVDLETQDRYGMYQNKFKFYFDTGKISKKQYTESTDYFNMYRAQFESFVSDVVNNGYYIPPQGTRDPFTGEVEKAYLVKPSDWSECLHVLWTFFYVNVDEAFKLTISGFDSPYQAEYMKDYCKKLGKNDCQFPCDKKIGWIRDTCSYKS